MTNTTSKGIVAILDLDGTLIDSARKLQVDVADAFGRLGKVIYPEQVTGDWYALAESYGLDKDKFDIEFAKRKSWDDALRDGDCPIFEDTLPALDNLRDLGARLGLLTRSIPSYTASKVKHFGLDKYFEDRIAITPVKDRATKLPEAYDLIRQFDPRTITRAYFAGDKIEDVNVAPFAKKEFGISSIGILVERSNSPLIYSRPDDLPSEIQYMRSLNEVAEYISNIEDQEAH